MFLTAYLWGELELEKAIGTTLMVCLYLVFNYFVRVKRYVLMQTVKPLFDSGVKSKDLDMAQVMLAYGKYSP